MEANTKTKLLVVGTYLDSEGYPNVRYRIQGFRQAEWLEITEINQPMWREVGRFRHSKLGILLTLFRGVYAHLLVVVKYLIGGRSTLVYVPYPAVFMGFSLGVLPRYFRPDRIVLDTFISLYDTVVNDRKLLSRKNWISILLKYIERKSYLHADLIITDTPQSSSYICKEFNLPEYKVVDVPLSTNEINFQLQPYLPNDKICRVLFIGTFVPLHGVSTILSAATNLRSCKNIRFRIVGTGQTAAMLEEYSTKENSNLEWVHTWQAPDTLAGMIAESDICLGIFGAGEKAQRVCPLKLYAYAACGRAIITGSTDWAQYAEKGLFYKPFETVPVNDGIALANRIRQLAGSAKYRQQLAENSRRFYTEQLCNKTAMSKFKVLLKGLFGEKYQI